MNNTTGAGGDNNASETKKSSKADLESTTVCMTDGNRLSKVFFLEGQRCNCATLLSLYLKCL